MAQSMTSRRVQSAACNLACAECGRRFRTVKAAERAMSSEQGCPRCGSACIDLVDLDEQAAAARGAA